MTMLIDREALLARHHELRPGEAITGTVRRLPTHGAYKGNALLLALDDGDLIALPATAKRGYMVLQRELEQARLQPGDRIKVAFLDWGKSGRGVAYRRFTVERIGGRDR